ncbi:hypothetical protein [Nocardia callitridis]|uniref:Uncharacterized protein n=1 Tax=Nocardia callitridis TaxID=648753 RepID=A0ABP9KJS9_9NOCA
MPDHQPTRITGFEPGTAALALLAWLAFAIGVAVLSHSIVITCVASALLFIGLVLVLHILRKT